MKKLFTLLMLLHCSALIWAQEEEPQTFVLDGVTYIVTGENTVGIKDVESSLTEIVINEKVTKEYTVTSIEEDGFYWSEATKIQLPNTITIIKNAGIYSCDNLVELNIPTGLTKLEDYALAYLPKITSITIPEGVTEIPKSCFANNTSMTEINLPDGITKIDNGAFYKCPITTFEFPDQCVSVGNNVFQLAESLTNVVLNEKLESFGEGTFRQCKSLTTINLQDAINIKELTDNLFVECNALSDITIPANVETIGINAFGNTNISEFKLAEENKNFIIENKGLYNVDKSILYLYPNKGEETFTVAEGCKGIAGGAFYGSQTKKVTLPESIVAIDSYAFCMSELSEINLPNTIVYIGEQAFAGTKLTSLVLPEDLTFISDGLCAWSKQLTSVTIPESVRMVYNHAFQTCTALKDVYCLGAFAPEIYDYYGDEDNPFGYIEMTQLNLHIPLGRKAEYESKYWNDLFYNIAEDGEELFIPVSIEPAFGDQIERIDSIIITFNEKVDSETTDPEIILRKGDELAGEEIFSTGGWLANIPANQKKTMIIFPCDREGLPKPIYLEENEKYYITIPRDFIYNYNNPDIKCQKIVIEVTGKEKEPVPFVPTNITPANNSEIKSIGNIEITFEKEAKVEVETPAVTVRKGNDESGELIEPDGGWMAVNDSEDMKTVSVFPCDYDYFISPITLESGISYYVTIPAGIFTGEGKMISEEIKLVFTGEETTAIAENNSEICFVVKNGNSFVISTGNTTADVEIFNAAGEIVSRNSNVNGQTTFAPESNGLYIIKIKSANGTKTFKVMK